MENGRRKTEEGIKKGRAKKKKTTETSKGHEDNTKRRSNEAQKEGQRGRQEER